MYFPSVWYPWPHPVVWQQPMLSQVARYPGGLLPTFTVGGAGMSIVCGSSDVLQTNPSWSSLLQADLSHLDVLQAEPTPSPGQG